jgi:hypothetical protein
MKDKYKGYYRFKHNQNKRDYLGIIGARGRCFDDAGVKIPGCPPSCPGCPMYKMCGRIMEKFKLKDAANPDRLVNAKKMFAVRMFLSHYGIKSELTEVLL